MNKTSEISGFYKFKQEERLNFVKKFASLSDEEIDLIQSTGSLKREIAERMIENVIGAMPIPLGIAVNFLINGRDYLIPMAIEEPSIIAAASNAAKMARVEGGFYTSSTEPVMIGQIQAISIKDPYLAKKKILTVKQEILDKANEQDPVLISFGGGAKDINVKIIDTINGPMVITELFVNCKDAMGANAVNTMSEAIAPIIERETNGKVLLKIISNFATERLARAKVIMKKDTIGGEQVVDNILNSFAFADADPYRCATHNKGIMNGIIAVAIATSNDTRALEAGAHAYAARSGLYKTLTKWEKNEKGDLVGMIEMPLAVGIIGGATAVHPVAKICRKILGVKSATELAEVMVAVGLAQNFAALRALATEGIQRGHMKLHARNIAIMAGAEENFIDEVASKMVKENKIRIDRAKEIIKEFEK